MKLQLWTGLLALGFGWVGQGCEDEPALPPEFDIAASARWSQEAATPEAVGYTITVSLTQRQQDDGSCRPAAPSTRLTVDNVEVPLSRAPVTLCTKGELVAGPFLQDQILTARLEWDGRAIAEVNFDGLMPGTAARLVTPVDGRVRAGDELIIVPPPELPTSFLGGARFYFLDEPTWRPAGERMPEFPRRLLDGIHLTVPQFTGRAILVMDGMSRSAAW